MKLATNRVESFSDGVIAIIITIMVFKIQLPANMPVDTPVSFDLLSHLLPYFIAYVVSFLMLGIIWVNHHHFMHLVKRTDEKVLWLNLHLLFWLSLIPFPTILLGSHPFDAVSTAIYGFVMFMNIVAISLLRYYVKKEHLMFGQKPGQSGRPELQKLYKRSRIKNIAGMGLYAVGAGLSFTSVVASYACFIAATALFFIPDGVDDEQLSEQIIEESK
jgi:uncharacterized membrane protein